MISTVTSVDGAIVEAGSVMSYVVGGVLIMKIMVPFILMFFMYKLLFGKTNDEKTQEKADAKSDRAKAQMLKKYNGKRRY